MTICKGVNIETTLKKLHTPVVTSTRPVRSSQHTHTQILNTYRLTGVMRFSKTKDIYVVFIDLSFTFRWWCCLNGVVVSVQLFWCRVKTLRVDELRLNVRLEFYKSALYPCYHEDTRCRGS